MQSRMLADIERVQVEAEGFDRDQQRIEQLLSYTSAAVLLQARPHQTQVMDQLFRSRISALSAHVFRGTREPLLHVKKEVSVRLRLRIGEGARVDVRKFRRILLDRLAQFSRDSRNAGGRTQQNHQIAEGLKIVLKNQVAG